MFISNLKKKISSTSGNIALGLLALMGFAAFVFIGLNQPMQQDVFLGAQVGKGGATAPDAPTGVSLTPGDSEVDVSWIAPVNDGGSAITDYIVNVYESRGLLDSISTKSTRTSYSVKGLTNDVEVEITVQAVNAVGQSLESRSAVATPTSGTSTSVPDAPTGLSATVGDKQLQLSWSAPANDGGEPITSYVVSVTQRGTERVTDIGSTATSYRLSSLTNGEEYIIKVAAKNSLGAGSYSSTITKTPVSSATAPGVPTGITLTPGDATITMSWVAPSDGGSAITGYTIAYNSGGTDKTIDISSGVTSYSFTGLTNGTSYSFKILAKNAVGSGQYSTASRSAPDQNIAPSIVGMTRVVPSDTSAIITWSTNKNTSTRVDFGLLTAKTSTPEYNKDTRVANHSVTLTDLLPCTTYSYVVKSYDALSQVVSGGEEKFTTTGCVTQARIQEVKEDIVDTAVGGVIDFTSTDVKTKLEIPQNLKAGESEVVFQVKLLEKLATKEDIGLPENNISWIGDHVYNLAAYSATSDTEVNNFDQPVTVSIEYSREDVEGIDLNTLVIHHYEEGIGWRKLNECSNVYDPKTGSGEISCNTNSFSVFGLFGETASGEVVSTGTIVSESSSKKNSNSSSNSLTQEIKTDSLVLVSPELKTEIENSSKEELIEDEKLTIREFNQDLWYGVVHIDVMNLQKFLNEEGFILAETGPGSPGKETLYFGDRTFAALKSFQAFYQDSIVAPTSFQKATGYFDYFTRQFIQENF